MAIQRVQPLTIRDVERRWMLAHGTGDTSLSAQELVTTSDQRRLWRGDGTLLSGGVDHGTVATEAALATLYLLPSCTRGVWPGDTAFVSATGCEYRCVSGSNATAVWRAVAVAASAAGSAAWGGITGDIADQPDLGTALAGKAATTHTHPLSALTQSGATDGQLAAWSSQLRCWVPVNAPTGGTEWTFAASPIVVGDYAWQSNGDTNGLLYALGVAAGGGTWTNPHTAGAVTVVLSSGWSLRDDGTEFVNRAAGFGYSGNGTGFWVGVDLGATHAIDPSGYTLQKYSNSGNAPRNWVMEGSNTVTSNTVAGFGDAQWTVLDTRVDDATIATGASQWGHFVVAPTGTKWRWLRLRNTGTNSSGYAYFAVTEFEFYDGSTIAVPAGFTGWAHDGAGHYVPYRG